MLFYVAFTVFSPTFSTAGKRPFIAGKAKKYYAPEVHFPGDKGVVECRKWHRPCWEI